MSPAFVLRTVLMTGIIITVGIGARAHAQPPPPASCAAPSQVSITFNELLGAFGQCNTMALILRQVAEHCFDGSGNPTPLLPACTQAVERCKSKDLEIQRDQAALHDKNEPALAAITGGWMGQAYTVQDRTILERIGDAAVVCNVNAGRAAIIASADVRQKIADKHKAIHAEFQRWLAWARGLSATCVKNVEDERVRKQNDADAAARAAAQRKATDEKAQREKADRERREKRWTELWARDQQNRAAADRANAETGAQLTTMITNAPSGGNEPRGTSSHTHFSVTGGMFMAPIIVDAGGGGVEAHSENGLAMGVGSALEIGYAPYHSSRFSIGLYVLGRGGGFALSGGSTYIADGTIGLAGSLGPEPGNSLFWRVGVGGRVGSTSSATLDLLKAGSAAYAFRHVEAGWRSCRRREDDARYCASAFELYTGTDLIGNAGPPVILGARLWFRRSFKLGIEVGMSYPRQGTITYPDRDESTATGTLFNFSVGKAFDSFGTPRRGTSRAEVLMARIAADTARRYRDVPRCTADADARRLAVPGLVAAVSGECYPPGGFSFGFAPGRIDGAIALDGTGDYLAVAVRRPGSPQQTLATWIYPERHGGVFVSSGRGIVMTRWTFGLDPDGRVRATLGGATLLGPAIAIRSWTHVSVTLDGATASLWINGQRVSQSPAAGMTLPRDELVLGGEITSEVSGVPAVERRFAGRIDDVRLYERALAADDILALAVPAPSGPAPPPATAGPQVASPSSPAPPLTTPPPPAPPRGNVIPSAAPPTNVIASAPPPGVLPGIALGTPALAPVPQDEVTRSYRWKTIGSDILGNLLTVIAFDDGKAMGADFVLGAAISIAATPILHAAHGNRRRAAISGLGRLAVIGLGTAMAIAEGHTQQLDPDGFPYVAIPFVGFEIIDAIWFPVQKVRATRRPQSTLLVLPRSGGGTIGVAGAF